METTKVFKFSISYDLDEKSQARYVVAESEDEAWEKLTTHFELMHREGYAKPVHIADPIVEIDCAII